MLRMFSYFRRGHTVYMSLAISMFNFITIQYQLLVKNVPWLAEYFPSMHLFGVALILIYAPCTAAIGYMDHKKLSMPVDQALSAKANPYSKAVAKALSLIAEGKGEEAKKVIDKWT